MGNSIGGISNNIPQVNSNDFEIVDRPSDASTGSVGQVGGNEGVEPHAGDNLIAGARVERPQVSELAKSVANSVAKRSGVKNFFAAIGRGLMNVAHVVKSVISFDFVRPSWWNNNVKGMDEKYELSRPNSEFAKEPTIDLKPLADSKPIDFDKDAVIASLGLGGPATIKEFKNMGNANNIYPHGGPRLSDIKQNPSLQDCWFLSSIAAVLSQQGAKAITRLIEVAPDRQTANVRLGDKLYKVPLGEVKGNGTKGVSNSAPWVKLLEQAMAMRVCDLSKTGTSAKMAFRDISEGMNALLGRTNGGDYGMIMGDNSQETLATIDTLIASGKPVVLGHVPGMVGVKDKIAGALRDNISPGHAVTVMDVKDRGNGKAWITVMDPYGRTRDISSSALKRTIIYTNVDDFNNERSKIERDFQDQLYYQTQKALGPNADPDFHDHAFDEPDDAPVLVGND